MLFQARNRGDDPWRSEARFTVLSEPAALNRLGTALVAWRAEDEGVLRVEL
jgi:hypothetical protein